MLGQIKAQVYIYISEGLAKYFENDSIFLGNKQSGHAAGNMMFYFS
jgi:hypothetical protein